MLTLLIIVGLCGSPALAAHYLFWLPFSSKSMKIGLMDMGYELVERGHTVTLISPFGNLKKEPTPGVRDIVIHSDHEAVLQKALANILVNKGASVPFQTVIDSTLQANKNAFNNQEVRELIDGGKVDVVCVATFGNEAGYYLAHKMNASLALVHTGIMTLPWLNWALGDPYHPATTPIPLLGYSQFMSFPQRLANTLSLTAMSAVNEFYLRPKVDALVAESFPDDPSIPSTNSLAKTSALLITHGSPFIGDGLRPTMPQTVQAALMSCRPQDPLPDHLKTFVDSAEHGVVFVSFGSVIKASKMPESKRLALLSVFSKMKQRVIWKWDVAMPDAPENVMVSSWLPQQSLLAHPNLVLFITHGGAGSLQETICHRTPMVGVPISTDQFMNVNEAVQRGIGVKLDWHGLTEDTLKAAVEEVLGHSSYQEAVNELNRLILDTPQPPLERAVWWLEYLLRNPGNKGMVSPGHQLGWTQHLLLDVLLVILVTLTAVIWLLYRIVSCCCTFRDRNKDKRE